MDLILLLVPLGFIVCFVILWAIGNPKLSTKTALIGVSFILFMALCIRMGIKLGENKSGKPAYFKGAQENQLNSKKKLQANSKTNTKDLDPRLTPGETSEQMEEITARIISKYKDKDVLQFRKDFEAYLVFHNNQAASEEEKQKAWQDFCQEWGVPLNLGLSFNDAFLFHEDFEQDSLEEWRLRAFDSTGNDIPLYPNKNNNSFRKKPNTFFTDGNKIIAIDYHNKTRGNVLHFTLDGKVIMGIAESKPIPFDKNRQYKLSVLGKSTGPAAHIYTAGYRLKPGLPETTEPLWQNLEEIEKGRFVQFKIQDESKELMEDWSLGTAQFPRTQNPSHISDKLDQIQFITVKITVFSGEAGEFLLDNITIQRTYPIDTK